MTAAAIYCRISSDPDGRSRSVDQQEEACRAHCATAGWSVAEVVVDSDISASRYSRKRRPGWARVLELVEHRAVDALVAWDLDRMLRQPKELEHLIDLADQGLPVVTLGGGDVNLASPDGRFVARILVAKAAKESDDISRRVRRAKAAKAARGEPVRMEGIRAFGWVDGLTPDAEQAELIRASARRVLDGEVGVTGLAREWQAAGWPRPRSGRAWTATTVRAVLVSRRNAGLVEHRGDVVGEAPWPAIVDRVTHERLRALFADPSRRHSHRVGTWTGVIVCGKCGLAMHANARGNGQRVWTCKPAPGSDRCGRVGIVAAPVEALVLDAVFAAVDHGRRTGRAPAPALDPGPAVAELADVERRLGELAVDFAESRVTRAQFLAASERLQERRDRLAGLVAPTGSGAAVSGFLGRPGALAAAWPGMGEWQRNAVLRSVVAARVLPVGRTGPRFDPARVELDWRV